MALLRLATVWLGGCSGCHMSFLDLDEWLIELAGRVELVFSPLADIKAYPEGVDLALVEGAVANHDHLELIHTVRERTRLLVSLGDCAVTGNVTALRNPLGPAEPILQRVFAPQGAVPHEPGVVPVLLDRVLPLHSVVKVDLFLPGCPPPAPRIRAALEALLAGELPVVQGRDMIRFG
jgi:NAD-reducing hydrogenase small subunit